MFVHYNDGLCVKQGTKKLHNILTMNESKNERYLIASFDGGGSRGIASATMYMHLEKEVQRLAEQRLKQSLPDFRLAPFFDLCAGTSTGSLIAASLCAPKSKMRGVDLIRLYEQWTPRIFSRSWWQLITTGFGLWKSMYSDEALKKGLEDIVGNGLLSEAKPCLLVPSYDMTNKRMRIFHTRSPLFNCGKGGEHVQEDDYLLRDVARASSAVPVLLPLATLESCIHKERTTHADGSLVATNPAALAAAAVVDAQQVPIERITV